MYIVTPPDIPPDATFDEVLQGQEIRNGNGAFYQIERYPEEFISDVSWQESAADQIVPFLQNNLQSNVAAEDLLFVDIETTGLSPERPLFLIGALGFANEPNLQLFFARHYNEEAAALQGFAEMVQGKTLITFNGRYFDWPFIQKRAKSYGVAMPQPRGHFDLLPFARKHWASGLYNCKLQTLEQHHCERERYGDTPSADIPARYERFLEDYEFNGNGAPYILPVIYHNYWDILTMAELIVKLNA